MSDTFDWRDPVSHWITSKSDQPFDTVASVPSDSLAISIMGDAQDFRDIGKLSKLQQINVFGLSQKNSSFLAEIPALQRLYIRGGGVKDLEFLKKLVNLDSLYLWQTVRLVSLRGLESATNLLSLTLFEATSNSGQLDLSPLASLPRLQYLELRGPMKVQSLTPLKEARSLKRIYVYVNVVNASIEPLLSLPALERIDMWKLDKTFSLDQLAVAASISPSLMEAWFNFRANEIGLPCKKCQATTVVLIGKGTRAYCPSCQPNRGLEFKKSFLEMVAKVK